MKYLLDTHVLIWFAEDNKKLSKDFKDIISNQNNIIFVSVASVWETVIKLQLKKMKLKSSIREIIKEYEFEIVNIKMEHVLELQKLPNIHKDPFDRLLISQAIVENMTLVSADTKFPKYQVNLLW